MSKITRIAFEQRYSDDSGVEFGVSYSADSFDNAITFERIGEVSFPADELDWLIECLTQIRTLKATPTTRPE